MIQQICHILYKPITVSVGDFDVKKSRIIKIRAMKQKLIVKPKSEVPKSKVPKSRPKGLGMTQ